MRWLWFTSALSLTGCSQCLMFFIQSTDVPVPDEMMGVAEFVVASGKNWDTACTIDWSSEQFPGSSVCGGGPMLEAPYGGAPPMDNRFRVTITWMLENRTVLGNQQATGVVEGRDPLDSCGPGPTVTLEDIGPFEAE